MAAATSTRATTFAPATVQRIDSARHPAARRIADVLRSRSERPKVFVLDDLENIEQAVACGVELDGLYATESSVANGPPALIGVDPDVPVHVIDDAVARSLFGEQKHSRIFALAHSPRSPRLSDLIETTGDIIVLDGVRLVGNIGAITRTACALGAAGIVLLESGLRTTLDRRLIRASRGLVFATPVILASRAECADFIQREQLSVAALSADAVDALSSIGAVTRRLAIVLGGERDGVSSELDALTAHRYAIPMSPNVESLNVSVAAGLALYEHRSR
ncbi:TrmH family RNA methyltransferase [Agromyces cerinus]|uniref:RNA methyltransferase, TrmH family n=1 Tax=Agromyces cerinus subsp. cerinus TaxID=232089 RepID=A0A1N6ET06_9MICO|nr:TrmH family RNA methyltransferase [Agromyces cerinus]SIN86165.1 RNA methyltransferase, TrmH family [Agromyces cerinus subsp. cerinus]